MSKLRIALFVLISIFLFTPPAQAAAVKPFSWWGQHGIRGYQTQADNYVIVSRMTWDYSNVNFYTIEGDTFKGLRPALTRISGSCYSDAQETWPKYSAKLDVDGRYTLPLFDMLPGQSVAPFDLTVEGQVFTIRIDGSFRPIGCNVLMERVR